MKALIKILLIGTALLWSACADKPTPLDIDMTIVEDTTDPLALYPTAEDIVSQLDLKDHPFQHIRIEVSTISDKDINSTTVITLVGEDEWSSNVTMRKAKISHFTKQLQQCLERIPHNSVCEHSIIYRAIARQANQLATSKAKQKLLLVYSDLYENDLDLNFYDPKVIHRLQKSPQGVSAQLEASAPLTPLKGLQLWLIYNPTSFRQNNVYMIIAGFYEDFFTAHGAAVHIANKFIPL